MLFDALGARESSMVCRTEFAIANVCRIGFVYTTQLDIASTSLAGSMMSLDQQQNSDGEEQDNFDDTIDMVHGTKTEKKNKKKREIDTQPEKGSKKHSVKFF